MEHELEPVRATYTLVPNNDRDAPTTTKLELEDEPSATKITDESETDSGEEGEDEVKLSKCNSKNTDKEQTNEVVFGEDGKGTERKRAKPKKRVSWIDLERGRASAVTQVFQVDSPLHYDRSPAPMRREQRLLNAETKMDKLLIVIIIALIVVILIRYSSCLISQLVQSD